MGNNVIHDVIMDMEDYSVLSADSDFYQFIGNRSMDPMDRFVVEEDHDVFLHYIRNRVMDQWFLLRLCNEEGDKVYFSAQLKEGTSEENVRIWLIDAERLLESERTQSYDLKRQNALFQLYGDTYFAYDPLKDVVRLYHVENKERDIYVITLQEFEDFLVRHAGEKTREIHQLIQDLRGGTRKFVLQSNRNLINDDDRIVCTTVRGASIYEDGKYIVGVGFVHLGTEYQQNWRRQTEVDSLTGLMAKAEITNLAIDMIDIRKIQNTALAIIDIDNFKDVNDTYGHMYGDKVIKMVAADLERQVGDDGVVGRIGGDEFLVIFYDVYDMENMRERMRSIKNVVHTSFPDNQEDSPAVTLSIGCASFPKDASNYEDLFLLTDFALYRAKEKGRDRYIIYNRDMHGDLETVKSTKAPAKRIDSRGDMSLGDILCVLMDSVYRNRDYPLYELLDEFVTNFGIQRILVYAGSPYRICSMAGEAQLSPQLIAETESAVAEEVYERNFDKDGVWCLNDIQYLRERESEVYQTLVRQGVLSFIKVRFTDRNGVPCILSIEAVNKKVAWNKSYMHYYRLFARLLGQYAVLGERPEADA